MSDIGAMIRRHRVEAGLTQEALAARIGCSKPQLSLMETGRRSVTLEWARRLDEVLSTPDGLFAKAVVWRSVPATVRDELGAARSRSSDLATRIRDALAGDTPLEDLRRLVDQPNVDEPIRLGRIPVINEVAAGYPVEFTDLGYPARVADEYVSCPDVLDPDAFAARVVGDSMEPAYREGEVVIFSPALPTTPGSDCFVRLLHDDETTFKRVYFEDDGSTVRLQPLNSAYAPRVVDRQSIGGMYAAAYVLRKVAGG